jgi:SNF2 family DNA or RNA helicase
MDILNKKCDLIVFDEGHRLKNKNSKVYRKILTFGCKKRILLTGTPLQNNL